MKYRYTLEKYRGIRSRYTCPQCGRKYVFTRYIDTETNQYIADDVGKCNRLDKCGYHYTPKQYFSDNSWREPVRSVFYTPKKTLPKQHLFADFPMFTVLVTVLRSIRGFRLKIII